MKIGSIFSRMIVTIMSLRPSISVIFIVHKVYAVMLQVLNQIDTRLVGAPFFLVIIYEQNKINEHVVTYMYMIFFSLVLYQIVWDNPYIIYT